MTDATIPRRQGLTEKQRIWAISLASIACCASSAASLTRPLAYKASNPA